MEKFEELIASIARRPAMFVGDARIGHVAIFLAGVREGLARAGVADPMAAWLRWIELRFGIWHPAWGWPSILVHALGGEEAAMRALPTLYSEYLAAIERDGVDGIERQHAARFGSHACAPDETIPAGCYGADRVPRS